MRQPVRRDQSYLANVLGIYKDGCQILANAVCSIDRGESLAEPTQPNSQGKYYSTSDENAVVAFLDKHLRFADGQEMDTAVKITD